MQRMSPITGVRLLMALALQWQPLHLLLKLLLFLLQSLLGSYRHSLTLVVALSLNPSTHTHGNASAADERAIKPECKAIASQKRSSVSMIHHEFECAEVIIRDALQCSCEAIVQQRP